MHMAQLMPLPLTVSCSSKIQIGFTFLVPAYPGCPGKEAVKGLCVICGRHTSVVFGGGANFNGKPPLSSPLAGGQTFSRHYIFSDMKLRQEISSSTINIAIVNTAEKRAPKQKGGCQDSLDTPWIRSCLVKRPLCHCQNFQWLLIYLRTCKP